MLSEPCFDFDILSDVLSSIDDCASVTSGKKSDSNGNLNSFNLSFTLDSLPNYKLTTNTENDALDDDLSALLDSCHSHSHNKPSDLISLASLADNHLSNNLSTSGSRPEKCISAPFVSNLKNDVSDEIKLLDCLEDILIEGKCEDYNKICTENLLNTLDWENSFAKDSGRNERNHRLESNKETVDDELIPDINLSFCIKKNNNKDAFSLVSSSPETSDSGFDEIDSSSDKCISSAPEENSSWENTFYTDPVKSTLIGSNHSLLSRAFSARPKIHKSRRVKLQNIRSELLKKYIPQSVSECKQEQNLQKFEKIIDQSEQCVTASSFLTIPGQ